MKQTTINGKPVTSTAQLHRLWAEYLDMAERWETRRPVASRATRVKLDTLSSTIAATLPAVWAARSANTFITKQVVNRYVRLEEELTKLSAEAPVSESFHVRKAPWAPDETRLDGDADELRASADEAEREAVALRFELHRVRKSTANRIKLAKLGLVSYFSWSDAWAQTKATMRELGAEIRQHEGWARAVERELITREREYEAHWNKGVVECDPDYNLPAETPAWTIDDYRDMSR